MRKVILFIVLLCVSSSFSLGQDELSSVDVVAYEGSEGNIDAFLWGDDTLVVTATKQAEHPFEVPATVIVITEEMIKERGYLDLKDVFFDLPGFDLSTNVSGEFATLVAQRGIGGNNKLVLLLDGEEITSPSGKPFPYGNNVPLSNAKKIEIIYGPASALYGPDAFGVVNIITKEADEISGIDVQLASGTAGTYDAYLNIGKKLNDDVSFTLFGRMYHTNGQDLSDEYEELNFIRQYPKKSPTKLVRAEYEAPVNDRNVHATITLKNLTLGYHESYYQEQFSKGLIPMQYVYNKEAYWGHSIKNSYLKHTYTTDKFDVISRFSYTVFEIDPKMTWYYIFPISEGKRDEDKRDSEARWYTTEKVHQYGKTNSIKLELQANYRHSENLNLTAGFVTEDITGLPTGNVIGEPFDRNTPLSLSNYYNDEYPQAALSSQNYGLFGQAKYRFLKHWYVTAGARYDYNTIYQGTFNPRAGLVYKGKDRYSVKLLYGSAFIAPSYFHRYECWFVPGKDFGHIQNPELQPETMQTLELNWMQKWRRQFETSVSLYANQADNLIVRRIYGEIPFDYPESRVDTSRDKRVLVEWNDNFGELESFGADIRFNYIPSRRFKLFANYSFMDGFNIDQRTGEKLDLFGTSTHKITGGFSLNLLDKVIITPRLRWVSPIVTRKTNKRYAGTRMPGYEVVNLNIRCVNLLKNLEMSLLINNLLNQKYYTAGIGPEHGVYLPQVPQELISALLSVKYRFDF